MSRQLPLELELDVAATFDGFIADESAEALAALRALAAGAGTGPVWLCGPGGSGKSHLLQATCRDVSDRGGRAMYLPMAQAHRFDPEILRGCGAMDLLAVDDVESIAGNARWEAALFAAVNEFLLESAPLVMASRGTPREVDFQLADLRSRAAAHVVYRLGALGDAALERLVRQRAHALGLQLDDGAARYLLRRVPRDVRVVEGWLERLDRASLAAQRRVTVALVREALADSGFETG